jgi:tight adherence protein C
MGAWVDMTLAAAIVALLVYASVPRGAAAPANGVPASPGLFPRFLARRRTMLRQAGVRTDDALSMIAAARFLLAPIIPMLAIEAAAMARWPAPSPVVTAALAAVGFVLPDLWMLRERQSRRRRIRRALSFYLDLVVALLQSGLTIEKAVVRAAQDGFLEPHPLADELLLLGREMDLGRDSAGGFAKLAERTAVPELEAVAAAMKLGMRKGASVEITLSQQAELLRNRYREEGIHRINRTMVLSMIPVFMTGVPMYAVIVFFPALKDMFEAWRNIRPF